MEHLVLGERVRMPVEIRSADACSAMFAVPLKPACDLLAYTGLEPAQVLPGQAVCSLAFVRYLDGDLGPYHEFAFALLVRGDGRGGLGAFIHWLPVDQEFTLAAGRGIWGFPKELADIDIRGTGRATQCVVRQDGRVVVGLRIRRGVPAPSGAGAASVDAYTCRDGTLRRTPWRMRPGRVRLRPGGADIVLGDHPVAEQLRALGLPRTALTTSSIGTLRMTFDDAEQVR